MQPLFPRIKPYATHMMNVGDGHTLYVEESGNPEGYPVVFLHGGPGSGCGSDSRRFFDPDRYRIVLFDQRGAGRSTPHCCLSHNTTTHLVADIEAIRNALGIDKWLVFGGSWGATLALIYAQTYPDKVAQLILRGVFLCRNQDVRWLYQKGASEIFPDYWQGFIEQIPVAEREDLMSAYYDRLVGTNDLVKQSAAQAWCLWEARCSTLAPNPSLESGYIQLHHALAMASIEAHYFVNKGFMAENQIINHADRIAHIPTEIVHGRYDMVCPVAQAHELQRALPNSTLNIVGAAGHSAFEPEIAAALVAATNRYAGV